MELDRALSRAASQWRHWRLHRHGALDTDEPEVDPLGSFRPVTGLSLFRELGELPADDPLREPLRRWVYRLAEQRINAETLIRLERERHREREVPDAPLRAKVSIAGMLRNCLSDRPRRHIWMQLFLQHAVPVSEITVELWQRRREVARRMGLPSPSAIGSPIAASEAASPNTPAEPADVARRLAESTRERIRELAPASPAELIGTAMGADVIANWPARLSPQRLHDYFRDGDLLRALDLRLEPLPPSLGAASFCRALGQLGAAWLEALAPQEQPFVVAHDAYGLRRHEAAGLFALLPLNAAFLLRHLEVPRRSLADLQRRLAQLWLVDLSLAAFRVRLRPHALASERTFRDAFTELAHQDLALSLPREAAGALFRLGVEDEQRLVGRLLAAQRERELVEAHDEDWFRNPRAMEQLRAEARRPPQVCVPVEAVNQGLREVQLRLERLLR